MRRRASFADGPAARRRSSDLSDIRVCELQLHQLDCREDRLANSGRGTMSKKPRRVDVMVGRNIRVRRLQRGLTQGELGGHLGVTAQQIQKYESGANRVGASRLDQIAGALAIPLSSLFDGSPVNGSSHSNGHAAPDLSGG